DVSAGLARKLCHHCSDRSGCAVRENALSRLKAPMLEQALPCRQSRDWQACAYGEVNIAREGCQVARLDRKVLGERAIAIPVCETKHALPYGQSRCTVAQRGNDACQFVAEDRWCSIAVTTIRPGRRPFQLGPDKSRCVNLNDDIVDGCYRL